MGFLFEPFFRQLALAYELLGLLRPMPTVLLNSWPTIRDGRNKIPSCFAVREGSVSDISRGKSIACARRGASG